MGTAPAGLFTIIDVLNNKTRVAYTKSEYPIVRAFAALCLLNMQAKHPGDHLVEGAHKHLLWLLANSCDGYKGLCWGLGAPSAISSSLVYGGSTPLSTITPYALEAFVAFAKVARTSEYDSAIERILHFFDQDLHVMEEDSETLATSYAPFPDRKVINAVSYTMYSYSLCLPYLAACQKLRAERRIEKLYAYIRRHQRHDGSWFYSPEPASFIDCFHSCIVVKNIIKTARTIRLKDSGAVVEAAYDYILGAFLDKERFLFRRFSIRNKPGLIRFDLYDNAEVLNLAILLRDLELVQKLLKSVVHNFCSDLNVYSQIDLLGGRLNRNTLRWAVMPFLYAASEVVSTF